MQLIVVGITGRLDASHTVHDVGQPRGEPGGQPGRVELEWQGGDARLGQPGHLRAGPNKAGHPPPAGAGRQADCSPDAARGARHQQMSGRVLEGRHQPTWEAREGWARSSSTRQTATSAWGRASARIASARWVRSAVFVNNRTAWASSRGSQ